jgi:hypothetical protein
MIQETTENEKQGNGRVYQTVPTDNSTVYFVEGDKPGQLPGVAVGDTVVWDGRVHKVKGDGRLWLVEG